MSKIDDLIKKYCPNGVEYKPLGEVTLMERGTSLTQKNAQAGEYPVISGGREPAFYCNRFNRSGETITVAGSGAGAGYVQYWNREIFVCDAFSIKGGEGLDTKYVYYYLTNIQDKIYSTKKGGGVPHVHISSIDKFIIPVPPLEVQREIVQILDNFTMLTAELSAELSARKKQYEFYRDQLLTFNNEVSYTPLGELFDFRNGLSKGKEFFGRGTPFVSFSDVFNHRFLHKSDIKSLVECSDDEKQKLHIGRGDVLFTRTSETAEDVGRSSVMLDDIGDCVFNGFSIRATPKTDKLIPEYCAYCFDTYSFRNYVTKNCSFTTRASLTGATIAEYKLPVPSINVQKRIVKVLDNFEAICSDLKIGLPAEIELRKKQYEYYRDMLLSFEPLGTVLAKQASKQAIISLYQYVYGYAEITLGDIALDMYRGSGITRDQVTNEGIPCVRYGEIYTTYGIHFDKCISHTNLDNIQNPKYFENGDIIFAITGESIEDIAKCTAYVGKEKCLAGGDTVVMKHEQNAKYLSYALSTTDAVKQKGKGKVKSKVVHSSVPSLAAITIPLPSLAEQERIVAILDRFDALVNDISTGIPAEIESRKKQYEYYRDKLLTFKNIS